MQNLEANNENIDPENFQTTKTSITRTQNFSFASTYQPSTGHFISSKQAEYNNITIPDLSNSLGKTAYNLSKPITSFSVLNSDEVYSPSSIVGTKPNAIVRPIRRSNQTALSGQNDQQQNSQQLQHEQETDTDSTYSQPYQYQLSESTVTQPITSPNKGQNNVNTFVDELNRKLSILHSSEHQITPSWTTNGYRYCTQDVSNYVKGKDFFNPLALSQRPLFITTVPTGVFLPPPKKLPLPAFLRPYVYSSHPVVLSGSSYNSNYDKSPTFSKDKLRSSTAPIAANDKHFMSTTTTTAAAPNTMSSSSRLYANHAQTLTGGVHLTKEQFQQQIQQHRVKREITKEPYKNVMFDRRIVRGSNYKMNRMQPNTEVANHSAEEYHHQIPRYRPNYERFKRNVGSKIPQPTRRDEVIQTDDELSTDIKQKFAEFSVNTQTELIPFVNDLHISPNKNCVDVSTEIENDELNNDYEISSETLVDLIVDACFEDAITEMAYETELEDLREKCKALEIQLSAETTDLNRLERSDSSESEQGTTAAKLLHGHIAKLVPEVLENLDTTSNIEPNKKDEVMKSICPWLTVEVAEEVGQIVDSREILTVIIEEIIKQRAAIYGDSKNMPEIIANIEEVEEITTDNDQTKSK